MNIEGGPQWDDEDQELDAEIESFAIRVETSIQNARSRMSPEARDKADAEAKAMRRKPLTSRPITDDEMLHSDS